MLSLHLESRILGLAQAKGRLEGVAPDALAPDRLMDPTQVQASTLWGPRLDRLIEQGRLSRAEVEGFAWDLSQEPGGASDDSWTTLQSCPAPLPDLEGQNLEDRFTGLRLLGEGALGRVYEAFDQVLQRKVALKFLKVAGANLNDDVLAEARAQAQVEHPHVCRVYEVGSHQGRSFIAMQFVEGQTLAHVMQDLGLSEKVALLRDVAEGLHAAHRKGLIHLDLKPGNILVQRNEKGSWQALATDFGMVRSEGGDGRGPCPMGTPPYSSPEQLKGDVRQVDRRSDVYSLGVMLYALLTSTFPFEAHSFSDLLRAIAEDPPTPLKNRNPNLPEDLEAIVQACLAKAPKDRYPSAQALADDLQRFLDGEAIQVRPNSLAYRMRTWARRHRTTALVASFGLVALLAAGGAGVVMTYQAKRQGEWAQHFEQIASAEEARLRQEYAMPAHDLRPVHQSIRQAIQRVEGELASGGRTARGPAHYALGRLCGLVHRDEDARIHLEAAFNAGFRTPEVRVALATALLKEFNWLRSESNFDGSDIQDPREARLKVKYLDRVEALLHGLSPSGPMAWTLTKAKIYQQMALGNHQSALQMALEAARENRPWDSDAWVVAAFIGRSTQIRLGSRTIAPSWGGNPDAFQQTLTTATELSRMFVEACDKAYSLAPGDPEARYMKVVADYAREELSEGEPPPNDQWAMYGWVQKYILRRYLYHHASSTLLASLQESDPAEPVIRNRAAYAWHRKAWYAACLGLDPTEAVHRALDGFGDVYSFQSCFDPIRYFGRTRTLLPAVMAESISGQRDPATLPVLIAALREDGAQYAKAKEYRDYLDVPLGEAYSALSALVSIRMERGEDPVPVLEQWLAAHPMGDRPKGSQGSDALATLWAYLGAKRAQFGMDPTHEFSKSLALLCESTHLGNQPQIRAFLAAEDVRFRILSRSPKQSLEPLRDLIEQTKTHPVGVLVNDDPSSLMLEHVERSLISGNGPGPYIQELRKTLEKWAQKVPDSTEVHERLAKLYLLESRASALPIPLVEQGLREANRALIYPAFRSEADLARPNLPLRMNLWKFEEFYHKGRTLMVKGELELALAKAQPAASARKAQAGKALQTLQASLEENRFLEPRLTPLIAEAKALAAS